MLDPGLEHLHRHGRLWRASNKRRRLISEAVTDVLLIPPVLLLLLFAQRGPWAPTWEIVVLVGGYALASVVRFEIGSGSTSPIQLMAVPLWFAVPPAFQPIIVGLALVLGGVVEHYRESPGDALWRCLNAAGDAWPAIGPALVFALAGAPTATLDAVPVAAAAFASQVVIDLFFGITTPWYFHRIRPAIQLRLMVWVAAIDASLAPIGFIVAVVVATQPVAIIALLPLIAVIGEFARERKERIDQALQLSNAYRGTAQLMGDVLEADDAYTGGEHTRGVVDMAVAVGLELSLEPREMRDLEFGALLHDIGKLRVPNEIINKPGSLNAAEWEIIRKHPEYGQAMLDRVGGALTDAGKIVRAHHERWDGMGYPDRLIAEQIPLAARIITVCDSFSAMTTKRSYSAAMEHDQAIVELQRCSGSQFDPSVVEALFRVLERDASLRSRAAQEATPATSPIAAAIGLRPIS
ncbi:MAG: HD-GYP domain-containing protein [Solirubrobacteraceae bacterium]|nr:HD-GYP domain-containing protein [Patulibacter sp.]